MARIAGISAREAGPPVKLAYFFTRRSIARLTGRETERMIEPLEMYAHVPGLLRGYARLEQATAKLHRFDERLKNPAELKAATLTHVIALENMRGRFNLALGIGAAGFSEGMVCAVPATTHHSAPNGPPGGTGGSNG